MLRSISGLYNFELADFDLYDELVTHFGSELMSDEFSIMIKLYICFFMNRRGLSFLNAPRKVDFRFFT